MWNKLFLLSFSFLLTYKVKHIIYNPSCVLQCVAVCTQESRETWILQHCRGKTCVLPIWFSDPPPHSCFFCHVALAVTWFQVDNRHCCSQAASHMQQVMLAIYWSFKCLLFPSIEVWPDMRTEPLLIPPQLYLWNSLQTLYTPNILVFTIKKLLTPSLGVGLKLLYFEVQIQLLPLLLDKSVCEVLVVRLCTNSPGCELTASHKETRLGRVSSQLNTCF